MPLHVDVCSSVNHVLIRKYFTPIGLKEMASEMPDIPVAGRTCHFLHNWKSLTQDPWVLRAVEGVKIDFTQPPHQARRPQPPHLSATEMGLVKEEIEQMLSKGAIRRLNSKEAQSGFYSNILLVPKKDGHMRPESIESVCGSPTLQDGGHAEREEAK